MTKAKKTKTQKGGPNSAKVVQNADQLDELLEEPGVDGGVDADDEQRLSPFGTPIIEPEFEKVDPDQDLEDEEEEEVKPAVEKPKEKPKEKPTQAPKGDEGEVTPSPLEKAALMELLPEKFRGEDPIEAIRKLVSSYGESESTLGKKDQELATAQRVLRGLGRQYAPTQPAQVQGQEAVPTGAQAQAPAKVVITPEEEQKLNAVFAGMDILEDPVAPLKAVYLLAKSAAISQARQEANDAMNARLIQYDAIRTHVDQFNRFRTEHPDVDDLRPEMMDVIKQEPYLDNPQSVEVVYNKAKEIRQARQTANVQQTTESVLSQEDFQKTLQERMNAEIERVKKETAEAVRQELEDKIQQGKAVEGTLDSGSAPSPTPKQKIEKPDATPSGKKKVRIKTDHGDYVMNDEELAGIITAEQHDDRSLLNL